MTVGYVSLCRTFLAALCRMFLAALTFFSPRCIMSSNLATGENHAQNP